ncbi:protein kinase [Aeromonas hydrophila]
MKLKINITNEQLESIFQGKIVKTFEGNSGLIYLVENYPAPPKTKSFPRYIAYKKCKRYDGDSFEIFKEETNKWFQITSRFVLPIQYINIIDGEYYVCMRAGIHGTLSELIKNGFDIVSSFNISLQIVKGLIDMHNCGIQHHQDLNPQNIMFEDLSTIFDEEGKPILFRDNYKPYPPEHLHESFKYRVMISDFGMANYFIKDPIQGKSGGKFAYKAPEQYDKNIRGFSPDLFALGVILCLIFTNKHPTGKTVDFALKKSPKLKQGWECWAKNGKRIIECGSEIIQDLITRLLSSNPHYRPSLEHVYDVLFTEFYKEDPYQAHSCKLNFQMLDRDYKEDRKTRTTLETFEYMT